MTKKLYFRTNEIKRIEEKERIIVDLAKTLKENAVPIKTIIEKTGFSEDEINNL